MPVSAIHKLSNYTVGGPSFTGTFSLEGVPAGGALCDKMGALINDGQFTQWVETQTTISDLLEHEFTLIVQDNLLHLKVDGQTYTFEGAAQPTRETPTTAHLRSSLTELVTVPAQVQNNHLIPIIETAQSLFGAGARTTSYTQSTEPDSAAYSQMAQMFRTAQITHRETVAAHERIIRDLIARGYSLDDMPSLLRESVANFAPAPDLSDEVARLRAQLTQAENTRDTLSRDLASLQDTNRSVTRNLTATRRQLADSEAARSGLAAQLAASEDKLSRAESTMHRLTNELNIATREHDAAKEKLKAAEATRDSLAGEATRIRDTLQDTARKYTQAQTALGDASRELDNLRGLLSDALTANRALQGDVAMAEGEKMSAEAEREALQLRLEDLADANARVAGLELELAAKTKALDTLGAEHAQAKLTLGQFTEDFSAEKERLLAQYEQLLTQYHTLEGYHRNTLLEAKSLKAQLADFAAARSRIGELTQELAAQTTLLTASASETGQLKKALGKAEKLNEQLNAQLADAEEQHAAAIVRLKETHTHELAQLESRLKEKNEELAALHDAYKVQTGELSQKMAELKAKHTQAVAEFEHIIGEQEGELTETAGRLHKEHAERIAQMQAEYEGRIESLTREQANARGEYEANLELAHAKVQEVLGEYQETIESQSKEIAVLKELQSQMGDRFKRAALEVEDNYAQFRAHIEKLQASTSQGAPETLEVFAQQAETIENLSQRNALLEEMIKSFEADSLRDAQRMQQLEELLEERKSQLGPTFDAGFSEGYAAAQDAANGYMQRYTKADAEREVALRLMGELKSKLAQAEDAHAKAKAKVDQLEAQGELDRSRLKDLEASLAEKSFACSLLESTVAGQSREIQQLEADLAETGAAHHATRGKLFEMIAEKNNLARKQLEEIERLQLHLIELEAALERKNEEIEEIAASMHERAERYLAQEGELRQELEDQRMALTQEAAAYRAQLDTKVQELAASHEKSLADLTSALKEQRAMISTLQASLREAQGNQEITRAQLEASEDEHAKLKATLRRKEADLAALREQYEDLSSNGDPNAWEKLVMETAEHSEILRQKHDLISKLEALEEERESNEVLLREAASRESAAKATAAAAAKELAQAHEIQKALEAQVALLEEKGEEEAFLVAQLQIAERRATKAEGELRDLMDAIKAANGKDPSGLIQLIFDQYQAFRTGKESKAA